MLLFLFLLSSGDYDRRACIGVIEVNDDDVIFVFVFFITFIFVFFY